MASNLTPERLLDGLSHFCSSLTIDERKSLITLSRAQHIPSPSDSPVLFSKVRPCLDKMVRHPPYHENCLHDLSEYGHIVMRLLGSPLTTALLIVYALGTEVDDDEAHSGRISSLSKELCATQTIRLESTWNWDAIFDSKNRGNEPLHPLFPTQTSLHVSFRKSLYDFRERTRNRTIFPHYSSRGVSSESVRHLLNRVDHGRIRKCYGNPLSFHRQLDRGNVKSRDIVHHYIRTGFWIKGKTELKQRWYPSQLLPRTYFSWSGPDIAIAGYLREFFNSLGDCFEPTERKNRVQPDWLKRIPNVDGGFAFYDLTSFTSWFHEQVPFLQSLSRYFEGCYVYLVGENLSLTYHDLGSLISGYIDWCNNFPEFVISEKIDFPFSNRDYRHLCAGFLGIPGNLITCTLAHGLAQAALQTHPSHLQVPGDDVGAQFRNPLHRFDIMRCASSLGVLQYEKVFSSPEACIYLKRLVIELGDRIELAPMLIHPLLPYLVDPTTRNIRSNRYTLPEREKLRSRAAHVLTAYHRDIWRLTKGNIDHATSSLLLLFSRRVHRMTGLPYGAIFQGREFGDVESEDGTYRDIVMKFSVEEDDCLFSNPDIAFAGRYVDRIVIRSTNEVEVSNIESRMEKGERYVVRRAKVWRFLEDMGYVRQIGIPGEKVTLVGKDARDAFLFASEPPLREVEVTSDLELHQLVALGIVSSDISTGFFTASNEDRSVYDENTRSWRYRKYVDLDDPRSAGFYGNKQWLAPCLDRERSSLSPDPDGVFLDY
jgi:hypothetical protein